MQHKNCYVVHNITIPLRHNNEVEGDTSECRCNSHLRPQSNGIAVR